MRLFHCLKNLNSERGSASLIQMIMVTTTATVLVSGIAVNMQDILVLARDTQKVANMRQLVTVLELAYLDNFAYPRVPSKETNGFSFLISELSHRDYLASLPTNQKDYGYRDIEDGQGYVLRVLLKDPESSHLDIDFDGFIEGIDCRDPFYCIKM